MQERKVAIAWPNTIPSEMIAMLSTLPYCTNEIVVCLGPDDSPEDVVKKFAEQIRNASEISECFQKGFAELQKLAEVKFYSPAPEEKPRKKFRGAKGYLNKQNLPFYMKF